MEKVYSKVDDVMCLAQEIENRLGSHILFNKSEINNLILSGVYCKDQYYEEGNVKFNIIFCKNKFLRIQISEESNQAEDAICVLEELIHVLSTLSVYKIGFPLALYETGGCITCEYAFQNIGETIEKLKNGTMFADREITNLRFLGNCNNCNYGLYELNQDTGLETLYCTKINNELKETQWSNTCENHTYIINLKPNIKVLCKSFIKEYMA